MWAGFLRMPILYAFPRREGQARRGGTSAPCATRSPTAVPCPARARGRGRPCLPAMRPGTPLASCQSKNCLTFPSWQSLECEPAWWKACRAQWQTESMNRSLKTLLLWLLLAALPFQGIAAAMKTGCGPMGQNDSAGISVAMAMQSHHHADASVHAAHAEAAADSTATQPSPDQPSDATPAHSACSACASCCVGAVAPPCAMDAVSSCRGSLPAVASPPYLLPGVVPGGLERPPKPAAA